MSNTVESYHGFVFFTLSLSKFKAVDKAKLKPVGITFLLKLQVQ